MPMPYIELQQGDKSVAGMMQLPPEMADVPTNWLVYFQVANCAESVAAATALGANVILDSMEVPTVGTIAVLADPHGAVFGIMGG